ncbi:hypothetical protein [Kineococcus rhizosphaerae]|uniref:Uncharacterized protein n=1 Tax=Kineococcus rhizosphaerae TaxID=559628 RepID=A0A2T0R5P3_9ACTN|nr:hypothetical protein [Kineococcus rhizosphaerae]PRY16064.1 hypothetical protein CLV37_104277 [Kineococcus rhizosphaerae]
MRFNPPPNWPHANSAWIPPADWAPEPEWGPVPAGWPLLVEDEASRRRRAGALLLGALAGFVAGALVVVALDLVRVLVLGAGPLRDLQHGLELVVPWGTAAAGGALNLRACRRRAAERAARIVDLARDRLGR